MLSKDRLDWRLSWVGDVTILTNLSQAYSPCIWSSWCCAQWVLPRSACVSRILVLFIPTSKRYKSCNFALLFELWTLSLNNETGRNVRNIQVKCDREGWEIHQKEKQAGTVLGQAQLKLELELYFTSFKICCIKLIQLVILCLLGGATLLILRNRTWNDWDMAETNIVSNSISGRLTGG